MSSPNPEIKLLSQQFSHDTALAVRYLGRATEDLDILGSQIEEEQTREGAGLTKDQLEELERLSMGLSAGESADAASVSESETSATRTSIRRELGAKTLPQAVYISIRGGLLPVEVKSAEEAKATLKPKPLKILQLIGQGMLSEEIAGEVGLSGRTSIDHHMKTIKSELEAKNRSHAIRRAFEESLFEIQPAFIESVMRQLTEGRESIERAVALFEEVLAPQS